MGSAVTSTDAATLCEPSRRPQVAALKRVFELWTLDQEFHDAYLSDSTRALAGTGLDVDPCAVSLILLRRMPDGGEAPASLEELPETFVWYQEFVEGRFQRNLRARTSYAPSEPRFRDWRLRQLRRCDREMGPRAKYMGHLPVVFELSSGCSMRCPFCALSAGTLKGVFRHTEENAELWRDVLARVHAIMGDAAGKGICYCATEPLDNPDYELFLADFFDEFGRVPQTTTAAATRDVERTRRLLSWGQGLHPHFDRLSLLSRHDVDVILSSFSPEELLFTDLLPQFEEAPASNLLRVGRNRGSDHGKVGTIACASGFLVNMWERSVRLVTPALVSDEHPTGELVYEQATFADGAGLEEAILGMIDRHMHETISIVDLFGSGR